MGIPQLGHLQWTIHDHPIKMDDLYKGTLILGNLHEESKLDME